jgi:hypothetical protein
MTEQQPLAVVHDYGQLLDGFPPQLKGSNYKMRGPCGHAGIIPYPDLDVG